MLIQGVDYSRDSLPANSSCFASSVILENCSGSGTCLMQTTISNAIALSYVPIMASEMVRRMIWFEPAAAICSTAVSIFWMTPNSWVVP